MEKNRKKNSMSSVKERSVEQRQSRKPMSTVKERSVEQCKQRKPMSTVKERSVEQCKQRKPIIGSILFSILFPIWTFIVTIIIVIISFFSQTLPHKLFTAWAKNSLVMLKYLTELQVQYKNFPKNLSHNLNGAIIASEHQSVLEIIALIAIIPNLTFVLKQNLMYIPFLGYALVKLRMIPVSRTKFNAHWMDAAQKNLENGYNVLIFPEGTRKKFGEEAAYRSGVFKLATQMKQKIIPVAIDTGKFWSRRSWIKKSGTACIIFGQPIEPTIEMMKKTVKELMPR